MADVVRQHKEIDKLNAKLAGRFRVFKGIEANILADGQLDVQPDERTLFEFVVASPHSLCAADDQTARMLGRGRLGRHILGHPRGRVFNSRPGVTADWPRVFALAAKRRVAIELDGNWHRQDIDFELARHALDAGCIFALDSDAHSVGDLRFSEYAIAHARLAGIPAARVINCWSNQELDGGCRRPARYSLGRRKQRITTKERSNGDERRTVLALAAMGTIKNKRRFLPRRVL